MIINLYDTFHKFSKFFVKIPHKNIWFNKQLNLIWLSIVNIIDKLVNLKETGSILFGVKILLILLDKTQNLTEKESEPKIPYCTVDLITNHLYNNDIKSKRLKLYMLNLLII